MTRRPGIRVRYFSSFTFSMFGNGLWLPLNGVFLLEQRQLSPGGVGGYFAMMAAAAMIASLVAGHVAGRAGPVIPFVVAGGLQAAGVAAMVAVDHPVGVLGSAVLSGSGNGVFFAMQPLVLLRLFGKDQLPTVLGRQNQILNIAMGLGALTLGSLVSGWGSTGYVVGFSINAVSFVLHPLNVMLLARATAPQEAAPPSGSSTVVNLFRPYRDPRFLPLIVTQFCVVAFGLVQLEAVFPVLFRHTADVPIWGVTAILAVNCVAVVAMQSLATRRVAATGPRRGITEAILWWLVALAVGGIGLTADSLLWTMLSLGAFAAVFAVGETLLAPSIQPLTIDMAPADRMSMYTAAVSTAFSFGMMVGPPITLMVLYRFGGGWYLSLLAVGLLVGLGAVAAAKVSAGTVDAAAPRKLPIG